VGRFDEFVADAEPRLRRALVAAYGPQAGADAVAAALAYGWEHWARVATMTNPVGCLYRVGQSAARRELRVEPSLPIPPDASIPDVEPSLIARLNELSEPQRCASSWSTLISGASRKSRTCLKSITRP
jgi:hypothetical protein